MAEPKINSVKSADTISLSEGKYKQIKSKFGIIKIDKSLWENYKNYDESEDKIELSNGVNVSLTTPPYNINGELVITKEEPSFGANSGITFLIKGMSIDINSKNNKKDSIFIKTEKSTIYVSSDTDDITAVMRNDDSSIWFH